ncbi:MAG: HPr(Ser) kinase/phosphatase [Clostridia bacterium]|nr:HPr(Ser) kinase/phosphatase [Clostridia bacterium]
MENDYGFEEAREISILPEEFAKANNIKIMYADLDKPIVLKSMLVNRPGLIFAGYEPYFAAQRVQVVGNAEVAYLYSLEKEISMNRIDNFINKGIPCIIMCRGLEPPKAVLEITKKYQCPLFVSSLPTSQFVNNLVHYLNETLADSVNVHGVLLDISGLGVLLTGRNGIGKSETALELVHRGHMLVADDVVVVKNIKNKLFGHAPKRIKNLLEVRGVGIINVEDMYGISGVLDSKQINLVVELVPWNDNIDRLGDANLTENISGIEIPKLIVPVIAGRNLAIVIEAATKNMRLKDMGKDATKQLLAKLAQEDK